VRVAFTPEHIRIDIDLFGGRTGALASRRFRPRFPSPARNGRTFGEAFHITSDVVRSWDQIAHILARAAGIAGSGRPPDYPSARESALITDFPRSQSPIRFVR
jgi:hypothetical protein